MDGFDGFEEQFAETRYGRLFFLHKKGAGRPIVFLHGIGASVKSWRKLLPFLPVSLDVYLIDLLGHGESDAPLMEYDIMTQVNSIKDLISSLKIKEPMLFGHSYGAWLATHYSLSSKIGGLIIEDSAGLGMQAEEIISSGNRDDYIKHLISESVKIGANEMVMRTAVTNFDRYLLTREILSKVDARTMLIWGTNDAIVDPKFGQWEHDSIPGSRLLMVPDGGHIPHWMCPSIVGRAITEFCGLPS